MAEIVIGGLHNFGRKVSKYGRHIIREPEMYVCVC